MFSRFLVSLVFVALLAAIGGFAVFAVWDMPVAQTSVEKTLDNSRFLTRGT